MEDILVMDWCMGAIRPIITIIILVLEDIHSIIIIIILGVTHIIISHGLVIVLDFEPIYVESVM